MVELYTISTLLEELYTIGIMVDTLTQWLAKTVLLCPTCRSTCLPHYFQVKWPATLIPSKLACHTNSK